MVLDSCKRYGFLGYFKNLFKIDNKEFWWEWELKVSIHLIQKKMYYYIIPTALWNINKTESPHKENNDLEISIENKVLSSFYYRNIFFY